VRVEARSDLTAQLRVQIISLDEVSFPLSRSFAMMLIEDESAPGHAGYRAWSRVACDSDESFDSCAHVVSIRLLEARGLPREHGSPPAGLTRDDVDASADPGILGEALYEIVVDAPGMHDHFEVGAVWGTTAYDEAGNGPLYCGGAEDPKEWRRSSP